MNTGLNLAELPVSIELPSFKFTKNVVAAIFIFQNPAIPPFTTFESVINVYLWPRETLIHTHLYICVKKAICDCAASWYINKHENPIEYRAQNSKRWNQRDSANIEIKKITLKLTKICDFPIVQCSSLCIYVPPTTHVKPVKIFFYCLSLSFHHEQKGDMRHTHSVRRHTERNEHARIYKKIKQQPEKEASSIKRFVLFFFVLSKLTLLKI